MSYFPILRDLLGETDPGELSPFYDVGLRPYRTRRLREPYAAIVDYEWPLGLGLRNLVRDQSDRATDGGNVCGRRGTSQIGKDGFQVCMDVTHFKPNELMVKVVDNCIVVEGKHEEREDDHGYIKRHFVRRYTLPEGYEPDKVVSTLSSDGVLTVSVPKPPALNDKSNGRVVQIQQTGPAHLNIKENKKDEAKEAKEVAIGDNKSKN